MEKTVSTTTNTAVAERVDNRTEKAAETPCDGCFDLIRRTFFWRTTSHITSLEKLTWGKTFNDFRFPTRFFFGTLREINVHGACIAARHFHRGAPCWRTKCAKVARRCENGAPRCMPRVHLSLSKSQKKNAHQKRRFSPRLVSQAHRWLLGH